MIEPQLFIESIDGIEISNQNFQATIRTVLEYSSTPSEKKNQRDTKITYGRLGLYLIYHYRQGLYIDLDYRQFGSPCYKTLCNQYATRVKDRFRVLGNESWERILVSVNIDKVPPWKLLLRIKNIRAPKQPTVLCDQQCCFYHPLDKARVLASTLEDCFIHII